MKKVIIFFIFLMFLITVNALDYNESFDNVATGQYGLTSIERLTKSDSTAIHTFNGDLGLYYWGFINSGSPDPTTAHNITINDYYGEGTNQLRLTRTPTVSENTFIFYNLNETNYFNNKSSIKIIGNASSDAGDILRNIVLTMNDECKLFITSEGNLAVDDFNNYCTETKYNCTNLNRWSANAPKNENIINFSSNNCNVDLRQESFNRIGFSAGHQSGAGYIYLDKLNLINIQGLNQLPIFNITTNETIKCINESFGRVVFEFDLDVYDAENDTLYYATNVLTQYTENITTRFYKKNCAKFFGNDLCTFYTNGKDYSFLDWTVYKSSTCLINEGDYNESAFNLYFDDEGNIYNLRLIDSCSGDDKTWYYRMGVYPSTNINLITEVRDIENNDKFDIKIYNEDLSTVVANLSVRAENNRLLFYNSTNLQLNLSLKEDILIELDDVDSSENTYLVNIHTDSYSFPFDFNINYTINNSIVNNEHMSYVGFTIVNGNIEITGVKTQGIDQSLDWSTTKPNNITVTELGRYPLDIYVTDEVDLNLRQNYKQEIFKLGLCRYTEISKPTSTDFSRDGFNIWGLFKSLTGDELKNYLNVLGAYEYGKNVLWIWVIISYFLTLFGIWATTGEINVILPLVQGSFWLIAFGFLLDYNMHLVSGLIILSMGLAMLFLPTIRGVEE